MPVLSITTNHAPANPAATDELLREFSRAVAQMLGKPERYVMVRFVQEPHLIFAGTSEPCAYLELKSIGLPEAEAGRYSATLCRLVERHFGIMPQRTYIEFSRAEAGLWGWNSGTF